MFSEALALKEMTIFDIQNGPGSVFLPLRF